MLQPDLFFAYGLSSGLSLAAGKKLTEEKSVCVNKYFLLTLAWLTVFYLPQIYYLLGRFPAWESMFVFTGPEDIPPWFLSLYSVATIAAGVLGFHVTRSLLAKAKTAAALVQVAWSMGLATVIIFVGWDGTGYQRLFYAGSGADWAAGVVYPFSDFFRGPVMITLLWLEALVLIPYVALLARWTREAQRSARESPPA